MAISSFDNFPVILQEVNPIKSLPDKEVTLEMTGSFFTPDMEIFCDGLSDIDYTFISDNRCTIVATTAATEGVYDLILENGNQASLRNYITVEMPNWIDLRLGGTEVTSTTNHTGVLRDADGLGSNTRGNWGDWIALEDFSWNREDKKTYSVVVKLFNTFMVGLFPSNWNRSSNSQYLQLDFGWYFNNTTSFWGLYQKNGTERNVTPVSSNLIRLTATNNGEAGGTYSVYDVSSGDWNDLSNPIIEEFSINSNFNSGTPLIPTLLPNTGGSRLQAFLID